MKSPAVILLLLIPTLAFSQTPVAGPQSGTWTAPNSPYQVTGEITIPTGQTLTINPGVEVNFQGHYKFTVNGNLQALGAENDSIYFTTDSPTTGWGGIRISSSDISHLTYCRIEYGKTAGDYPDMHGGALALLGSDAVLEHCVLADNDATGGDLGMGGAVYAYNTGSPSAPLTRFTDCRFIRNHAYGEGGAVKFTGDMNTEFTRCEFIDNNCNYGGGAISCYIVTDTKVTNCLFVDNYTMYSNGGAINTLGSGNTLFLINCTFTSNDAVTGDGGAIDIVYGTAYLVNTIVFDNNGMYSDDLYLDWGGYAEIHYSNLPFPSGGTGGHNIDVNPLFVDGFNLDENSLCVDAGTANITLGGLTIDISPDDYCDTDPDIGAYEYCSLTGVFDDTLAALRVNQNYPNPFNAKTAISYNLPADQFVTARVFDVKGREVRTLVNTHQAAGPQAVFWNGQNDQGRRMGQGVYFLRLRAGNEERSVRMLLSK